MLNNLLSLQAIVFVLLICNAIPAMAQEVSSANTELSAADNPLGLVQTPNQKLISAGFHFGSAAQQDAVHSPIRYNGFIGGVTVSYRSYSRDILFHTSSVISGGFLSPAVGQVRNQNARITAIQSNVSNSLGFAIYGNQDRTTRIYAGPLLNVMANLKLNQDFGNSAPALDIHLALGGSLRIEKDFTLWNKQWRGSSSLNIPLVGFAQRPYYSTLYKEMAANESSLGLLGDLKPVSFLQFTNIEWNTGIEYMLGPGNWLGLHYQWNFYDYTYFTRIQSAGNTFLLILHFRLE